MAIQRQRPVRQLDNPVGNPAGGTRADAYGGSYVIPLAGPYSKNNHADAGESFIATNPTPGTALAFAVNASSDFTKSLFILKNQGSAGGIRIFLDYLKILPTVAPASGTSLQLAIQVDPLTDRLTSGGTTITAINQDPESSIATVARLTAASGGAVITTTAASSNVRLVHRSTPRSVIPAVLEEIVVQFGSSASEGGSSATTAGRSATTGASIIIPGQASAVFNVYFPSNSITGLSYEFELAWHER